MAMIRHLVLFWLKDKTQIDETIGILESMRGKIPGLVKIEAGKDVLHSERSCDICLHTVFETKEALDVYRTHPVHIPVQKHMHAVMERSVSADYEVDAI
jgi:hypothetical protein